MGQSKYRISYLSLILLLFCKLALSQNALVFQTDFGLEEPAVASMKGVAYGVSSEIHMFDITHEIPQFDIWEAAYRLNQAVNYWPSGTVFVSVIDPGVGTKRKSIVLRTKSGHFFVSPDNGSLTLVAESLGISEVREINENTNRLNGSERSHTFHGRDVYAYTGARLASGVINFDQVGRLLKPSVMKIKYKKAKLKNKIISGNIPILDAHYGNIWTNISIDLFDKLKLKINEMVWVIIKSNDQELFSKRVKYTSSFGGVDVGEPVIYVNDILNIGLAINQENMAEKYNINPGPDTVIEIWR